MPRQQDSNHVAMTGKLSDAEEAVRELFLNVDRAVEDALGAIDRGAIRRGGNWLGRSYRWNGHNVIRIDVKLKKLRIWVGEARYETAPVALKGQFRQTDWLDVSPDTARVLFNYLPTVFEAARTR